MNLTAFAIRHRSVIWAFVLLLSLYGVSTFLSMSRRENPEIKIRTCVVSTQWPGATAEKVEDLVTDPLETVISKIDEVEEIRSESRTGLSLIFIDMDERLNDVDQLWDEVRSKVELAVPRLPGGCGKPFVNADFGDVYDIVIALRQTPAPGREEIERPYSFRELELIAETIEDDLKGIASVAKVDKLGVQNEVIDVEIDTGEWSKIAMTVDRLRKLLQSRNITASGGEINTETSRLSVTPTGEFTDVSQIGSTVVDLMDGALPVALRDLPISINRTYADPPTSLYRFTEPGSGAAPCLLICVSMKKGSNVVQMGEDVDARIRSLMASTLPPDIALTRVNDLPRQVDDLVKNFMNNLVQAVVIVIAVALLMMGWRAALIMATAIPLSMVATIALVSQMGVELEQFSIASLIIAMGMVVDNAIVVSDNTLSELARKGQDRETSCIRGAWDLAIPMLTSTLTTVGAFAGMLTIIGTTGEFVRSLPVVVATTLLMSYVVAMMVTPIMCLILLKPAIEKGTPKRSVLSLILGLISRKKSGEPSPPAPEKGPSAGAKAYDSLVRWCLRNRTVTLAAAVAAVIGAVSLVPSIGNEFFPQGVRDQFFIHVWLPEGASLASTEEVCEEVEEILTRTSATTIDGKRVERLKSATTFVGTGGPRLTLTLQPEQTFPNYAHILVNTTDGLLTADWAKEVRAEVEAIAGAQVDVRSYELGPYIKRPVEFRLIGDDADVLRATADEMVSVLRKTAGAKNPSTDWRNDTYQMRIEVDDRAANLAGVTNLALADTLSTVVSGGYLTTYREGDHTVPVLLRTREDRRAQLLDGLDGIYVNGRNGKVPLGSIAEVVADWQPAVIGRLNQRRCVNIGGTAIPGALPNAVAAAARPKLEAMMADLPATYRLEDGGSAEKTAESGEKLSKAFSISVALILLTLICQYNSFAMPILVLLSVPLSLVGALIGLFTTGWALGFMPNLGILALAGIVINNAIILFDTIETNIREGAAVRDAIADAGAARMRPIMLSMLTTVGGLVPLALFGGPMWAGMAWAMVFGLVISTAMTLLVTPTLYSVASEVLKIRKVDVA